MPLSPEGFQLRVNRLKADLIEQARRVQSLVEDAFDAAFARDQFAARRVIDMDEIIDRVDVDIEKAAVVLLDEATNAGAQLDVAQLRMVLTIVKVNNELERIADAGVAIGEIVPALQAHPPLPDSLRVITNSVAGILRDACTALDRNDGQLAKIVLASEDAVEEFKDSIVRGLTRDVASGEIGVDAAFLIQDITTRCEIMAGHCTNIAEQALYVATGSIVRHMHGHWQEVPRPANQP